MGAGVLLPIIGAALAATGFGAPLSVALQGLGLGGVAAGALGTGLASAGGSFAGGLLGGNGFRDSLKGAGIAGLTAGVGNAALGALNGSTALSSGTVGTGAGGAGAAGSAAGAAAPAGIAGSSAGGDFLAGGALDDLSKYGVGAGGSGLGGAAAGAAADATGGLATVPYTLAGKAVEGGASDLLGAAGTTAAAAAPTFSGALKDFISAPSVAGVGTLAKQGLASAASNPGALLSAGGLVASATKGNQPYAGENELASSASQLAAQGAQNSSYLQNGTLPAGVQTSINQAGDAAKAAIRSRYASMGLSGSSSEQQELASADASIRTQGAGIAMQLLQNGTQQTGLADGIYASIMANSQNQDKALADSFANFGASLGGGAKT